MDEEYREYIKSNWTEAEEIARQIGSTSNNVVVSIFDKICQPYYYWSRQK